MTRAWLGALLAVVLLTGCDVLGSSKSKEPQPKRMSRARFVRVADRACSRDLRRTKGLPRPTNRAMLVRELRVAISAREQLIVAFRKVTPPRADAASFQRLLGGLDAEDLAAHELLDSAEAGQVTRAKTLARKLDRIDRRLNARARELGLRTCAKD